MRRLSSCLFWHISIGIGGDYPLSAVITSEFAATRFRGRMMIGVFAMQGFGNITGKQRSGIHRVSGIRA